MRVAGGRCVGEAFLRHPMYSPRFGNAPCTLWVSLRCVACSMTGGELFDRLVNVGAYSENDARTIFKQVAEGLVYLHA